MSIHMTAEYRVRPEAVDQVTAAIRKFVGAISTTEPGTRLYAAWQDERDAVHFFHHFIFDDEAAEQSHRSSSAVKDFTTLLYPQTVSGVHFTRYREIAAHRPAGGAA